MPVVVAVRGCASAEPKSHSYLRIVDVAPETVAVKITVCPTVAVLGLLMITEGGWAGSTVTEVDTCSVNPLASVAVALTIYVFASA